MPKKTPKKKLPARKNTAAQDNALEAAAQLVADALEHGFEDMLDDMNSRISDMVNGDPVDTYKLTHKAVLSHLQVRSALEDIVNSTIGCMEYYEEGEQESEPPAMKNSIAANRSIRRK